MEIEEKEEKQVDNEEISIEQQANAMKENYPAIKLKEKDLLVESYKQKIIFYNKNKIEVTFRLKNHQEYFITGKIIKIIESKSDNNFLFALKLKNKEKSMFSSFEIDFETLIPSSYNPIRYFIREKISEELRNKILNRDNYTCQLKLEGCSNKAEEIDHLIPVSKGGLTIEDNLQASCSNCNRKKNNNLFF
jgi:hypothetical protein